VLTLISGIYLLSESSLHEEILKAFDHSVLSFLQVEWSRLFLHPQNDVAAVLAHIMMQSLGKQILIIRFS